MEDSKPSTLMEDWRKYIQDPNRDIFEIIDIAIMVAASVRPTEFKSRRDQIVRVLFSEYDKSLKKESHKVSHEAEEETNMVYEGLMNTSNDLNNGKRSMVIKLKLNRETECRNPKGPVTPEIKVNDGGASRVYNQQGLALVMMMKEILEKTGDDQSESESVMCDLLAKLESMELSMKTLEATGIGKTVNALKKHASEKVRRIAVTLVKEWKRTAVEWLEKKSTGNEAILKPTDVNVNVNMERQLEGSELKDRKIGDGGVKVMKDSSEEKMEATKRRLHESYEKEENMKKKRRIQVIELYQVMKEGLLPSRKQQNKRKVNCRRH